MDVVFFMTITQVKIKYGATVFHVEFKIVGTRAARFFGDSDGFGGADFALRQRLLLVALIGEGESNAGQDSQAEGSEEGFVHTNLSACGMEGNSYGIFCIGRSPLPMGRIVGRHS